MENRESEARAISELALNLGKPEVITAFDEGPHGKPVNVIVLPDQNGGKRVESLQTHFEEYREEPLWRTGVASFQELDSLVAHANRFSNKDSALFAVVAGTVRVITAIYDYHDRVNPEDGEELDERKPLPRNMWHRGKCALDISDELRAWMDQENTVMDVREFAEFLEDRILDVMAPPDLSGEADAELRDTVEKLGGKGALCGPTKLMELSRGLQVNVDSRVKNKQVLASGEVELQFEEEHKDSAGKPLKVPSLFCIAVPVFQSGGLYRIVVRLRYRVAAGRVSWFYKLHRLEKVVDHAWTEACDYASEKTGLPLFKGAPESTAATREFE